MRYYCLDCEKLIEVDSDDPKALTECPICHGSLEDAGLAPGTEINGYEIIEELGRGSYGIVYRAKQLNLERDVALKILSRSHEEEDFVINFFREARAAAGLSHPNIVQAYDAGITDDGTCYFAMELVDGENVDDKLENQGALRADEAYNIALKIASALQYAWDRRKLTHGDIKPENIIINRRGEPKLADLGLAKSAFDDDIGHIAATPLYAPPEVIRRTVQGVNVQTDIYSFGGTVYHMFAGVPPFNEEDSEKVMRMHLEDQHEPLYKKVPVITRELSDFVDRMLAKEPVDRPESWAEIVEFFEDSAEVSFRQVETTGPRRLSGIKKVERIAIGVVVFILLGVTGWFIGDYLGVFSSTPKTVGKKDVSGGTNVVSNPVSPEAKWLRLKLNLSKISPGAACKEIESFLQHNQILIPAVRKDIEDARQKYEKAEKEYQEAERKRLKKLAFEDQTEKIYKDLMASAKAANEHKMSIKSMQMTVDSIQAFLNKVEKDEKLAVALGRGKRLNLTFELNKTQSLLSKVREQERFIKLKHAKIWGGYRRGKEASHKEIQVLFKDISASNSWYQALSKFISSPQEMWSRDLMKECLKDISMKDLKEEPRELYRFATTSFPVKIDILPIFQSRRDTFIGRSLPWPDKEHSGSGYKVKQITAEYIYFYGKMADGVFTGFKMPWDKLTVVQQYAMLEKWLIEFPANLSEEEKITIAFWILTHKGQRDFYNYSVRHLSSSNAANCRDLLRELLASRRESAAAVEFSDIRKKWNEHKYDDAAIAIVDFQKQYSMTKCGSESKELFNKLNEKLLIVSPLPTALDGIVEAGKLLDHSNYPGMLKRTSSLANRCLDLPVIREVIRVKVLDNLESALTQIAAKSGRKLDSVAGADIDPLAAAAMIPKYRRYTTYPAIADCYLAGCRVLCGDMQPDKDMDSWLKRLNLKMRNKPVISPYLLLAGGIAVDLQASEREKFRIERVFEMLMRDNAIPAKPATMVDVKLASCGYALITRRFSRISTILGKPDEEFKKKPEFLNRHRLYRLLGEASELNSTSKSLKNLDIYYQSIINVTKSSGKDKKADAPSIDEQWISTVIDLAAGDKGAIGRLPELSKCSDPKMSGALLTSIVAASEPSVEALRDTVELCRPIVGNNVSVSEIWYRVMLLDLVATESPEELITLYKKYSSDQRASAQPYVSRMVFLGSIVRLITGVSDLKTEPVIFRSFHNGLNAALQGERGAERFFDGRVNERELEFKSRSDGFKSLYWPVLMGGVIDTLAKKPDGERFYNFLRKNSYSLLPEERLLIQRLPGLVKSGMTPVN